MKKLLSFLLFSVLLLTLTACGEDPNVKAFKERLGKSDWAMTFMGVNGITFRFNEDGTGQATSDIASNGQVANFKYTVTDATENGDSAIITLTPDNTNEQNSQSTSENELDSFSKMKATFAPGGLSMVNPDEPDAKAVLFKPVEKY